jgi:hypothetical protein
MGKLWRCEVKWRTKLMSFVGQFAIQSDFYMDLSERHVD